MKRNTFNLLMVLGLVLALGGGIVMARRAQAQGPGPEGPSSIQAAVGTAFTYQGRLEDASGPVNDTCGFGLSLYGSSSGVDQIGTTQDKPNVSVSNGYFTVTDLDFCASAFDGNARYLEIAVDCGGGGVTLDPRVALNAAPYAHSLRPGAKVESAGMALQLTTSATSGSALNAIASAGSGTAAAVYGSSSSPDGAGISGSSGSSGYGVYGSSTTSGYGVYGKSGTASGKPALFGVGVWGDGDSSVGVYGTSNSSGGVFGWSTSSSGVVGMSTSGNGVDGVSSSGSGVYGTAPTTGTVGIATAGSGTNYGVYGKTNSPDGYGVYAQNTASGGAFDEPTAIYGEVNAADGFAVMGINNSGRGVYGEGHGRYGVGGFSYASYGVFGKGLSGGIGVMGESAYTGTVGIATSNTGDTSGVYGKSESPDGAGGRFVDLSLSNPRNSAGVWAGSYWSDIIQGHELNADGSSANLRFRVDYGGDVYADGTYSSPAADFAEMLPGADGLEPGDVLVIGPDGQLARSTEAYASAVVGVYSTKPAFVGGSDEEMENPGKVPLAIVGIVPVKASAENGAIAPGDLLVASSTPGHAMKAGPSPSIGTVIGKALEGLDSGTGVIQMLVTLQ
jgi:hypothetical protein